MKSLLAALAPLALLVPQQVLAESDVEAQSLELAKRAIALRSVAGEGNRTIEVARLFADRLVAGGWARDEVEVVPFADTAYLIATWPGSDPSLGPIVISAHMDVVDAKPEDWERDPFTPVVENGYLYGRGASDTKFDAALAIASLIELRRQGFRPKRSIIIAYSGDEETTMATSKIIAQRLANASLVINIDTPVGVFSEETGEPQYLRVEGAEKTYVDFELTVTNPGGHSSLPRADNAIVQLAQALERIGSYRFKPEANAITRAYFEGAAALQTDPKLAAAMLAFARNPSDSVATAILLEDPFMASRMATTCTPTMVSGGHAENALPQSARAIVNCRIFPGHSIDAIMAELRDVAAVPEVTFRNATGDISVESPPSPLDPALMRSIGRALGAAWGPVKVLPAMAPGASDSMWFRARGVPSYTAGPSFIKDSDDFAHGLNERVELRNIAPGIRYYNVLLRDLASK